MVGKGKCEDIRDLVISLLFHANPVQNSKIHPINILSAAANLSALCACANAAALAHTALCDTRNVIALLEFVVCGMGCGRSLNP